MYAAVCCRMLTYADVCWQRMERIEVAVRDANTSVEAVELVVRCLDMAGHSLAHVRDAKSALVNYCLESLTLTHAGGIRADLMPRTQGTTHTHTHAHASGHHGPHATVDIEQLFAACCFTGTKVQILTQLRLCLLQPDGCLGRQPHSDARVGPDLRVSRTPRKGACSLCHFKGMCRIGP